MYDIGIIGSHDFSYLVANAIAQKGYAVAFFSPSEKKPLISSEIYLTDSVSVLINSLKKPRCVLVMIKENLQMQNMIDQVLAYLESKDILIDGEARFYKESEKRYFSLKEKRISFIDIGISGTKEAVQNGFSIMAGGDKQAWESIRKIFLAISAQTKNQESCCQWIGSPGAGHYVKWIHDIHSKTELNLIAEFYSIMKYAYGLDEKKIAGYFNDWNKEPLIGDCYQLQIAANVLSNNIENIPDIVEDSPDEKMVMGLTIGDNLSYSIHSNACLEVMFARLFSEIKDLRGHGAATLKTKPHTEKLAWNEECLQNMKTAFLIARILACGQTVTYFRFSFDKTQYEIKSFGNLANLFSKGAVAQSDLFSHLHQAIKENPSIGCILSSYPYFTDLINKNVVHLTNQIKIAFDYELSIPVTACTVVFLNTYKSSFLPFAQLIRAQENFMLQC